MRTLLAAACWSLLAGVTLGQATDKQCSPQSLAQAAAELEKREADLVRAQSDIARLRQTLGLSLQPLTVRVFAMETHLEDLQETDLRLPPFGPSANRDVLPRVQELVANSITRMVCDQTFTVVPGRQHSLRVSEESPVTKPEERPRFTGRGIQIELLATPQGDNVTAMNVRLRWTEPDTSVSATAPDGKKIYGRSVCEVLTGMLLKPEQTWLTQGPSYERTVLHVRRDTTPETRTETKHKVTLVLGASLIPPEGTPAVTGTPTFYTPLKR
jgi:hypothetical protein